MKSSIRILLILLALLLMLPQGAALAEQTPVITTKALVAGMSGVFYGNRILAEGERPMLFAIISGDFPKGLTLGEQTGILTGKPAYPGSYAFRVRVTNPAGSSYADYRLNIAPYDESQMAQGGEDEAVIGAMEDSLSGVANAVNGGRLTMQEDVAYFVDTRGYLYSLEAPFSKKAKKMFEPRKYAHIDSLPNMLYYYQQYLDNEASAQQGKNVFVTRIVKDPIVGKGRDTLVDLQLDYCHSLSVTQEQLLFIGYEGVMVRAPLGGRKAIDMRTYHDGEEIAADLAFPFNGKAYFRQEKTGWIYSAWLDGELAMPLVQEKALCYTLANMNGETRLVYADSKKQLHSVGLEGDDPQVLDGMAATALNANEDYLFFADAANKNRLSMVSWDRPDEIVQLTDFAVDQIYAFENYVACRKKGGQDLYIMALGSEDAPVKIKK